MITIAPTSKEEIQSFNSLEWMDADNAYYGVPIQWTQNNFVYKAEDDGIIVGSVFGHVEEGVLGIKDIIVARDRRRKGVGKLLMEQAEKFGKANGAHKAHIIGGIGWGLEEFYNSCGYQQVAQLKDHFRHKDFGIYEKTL